MRTISSVLLLMVTLLGFAQPEKVTESIQLTGQSKLELAFDFADQIDFKIWDKQEVLVEVTVEIDNGEHNDIFTMTSYISDETISVEMDDQLWDKLPRNKNRDWNCNHSSRIDYLVYLPRDLEVSASTINGDYEFEFFGQPMELKTISGAIDISIPASTGLDFSAKTISGEVYSDLEIQYPEGKEGLRKIVGQDFKGRINGGGTLSLLETISGNIYLRKG